MKVYIVMSIVDMSDCVNSYGESAGDYETIMGIYDSIEKAEESKKKLESENETDTNECDCDPTYYRIDTWEVK